MRPRTTAPSGRGRELRRSRARSARRGAAARRCSPAARYWLIVDAPPADRDVPVAGRLCGQPQRLLGAAGDEVERRPALHLDRIALVVGEHEDRRVVRRVLAPPAAATPRSHSPRSGPNMFRPMMYAPAEQIASRLGRVARSGSSNIHRCSASPPTPSGCSRSWSGPAMKPSSEIAGSEVRYAISRPSPSGRPRTT